MAKTHLKYIPNLFDKHRVYNKRLFDLAVPTNAVLSGKLQLAKISEARTKSQLLFVRLENPCYVSV